MLNSAMIDRLHLSKDEVRSAVLQGARSLARREKICRGEYPAQSFGMPSACCAANTRNK
jgi:hypothetical protein